MKDASMDKVNKVRIKDVARRAGVSTATVSRVLANRPYASEETKERVARAVADLHYRPNRVARSLRIQRSAIVALIIPDIENPFFHRIVRAVQDTMAAHQCAVFLCNTDENLEKQALSIDLVRAEQVAGVIIAPVSEHDRPQGVLRRLDMPTVVIDRKMADLKVDTVRVENAAAAEAAVAHLIADGHRRIGAVLGTDLATTGRERREGYARALSAHGIAVEEELIAIGPVDGANRQNIGYGLVQRLLDLPKPPTAIFTGTNLLTLGVLQALQERELSIPDDVAIAAFDEIDWMPVFRPALTAVAQPVYEIGRQAAELLLERFNEPDRPSQDLVLPASLIIRQSCARHDLAEEIRPTAPQEPASQVAPDSCATVLAEILRG
jgi:DNA-binding LacI/PurR family transcriptional regulator